MNLLVTRNSQAWCLKEMAIETHIALIWKREKTFLYKRMQRMHLFPTKCKIKKLDRVSHQLQMWQDRPKCLERVQVSFQSLSFLLHDCVLICFKRCTWHPCLFVPYQEGTHSMLGHLIGRIVIISMLIFIQLIMDLS